MTTRREFGRGLAAIIAAGTAPSIILPCEAHNAGLLRGVGVRNAMMGGVCSDANRFTEIGVSARSGNFTFSIKSAYISDESSSIVIDWGDDTIDIVNSDIVDLSHTYSSAGIKTIKISDDIKDILLRNGTGMQWGMSSFVSNARRLSSIRSDCFYYFGSQFKEFKPSESIESIGNSAFYNVNGLSDLDMSKTRLRIIGNYAFRWNSSLKAIRLPSTIESIGTGAFDPCSNVSIFECMAKNAPSAYQSSFGSSSGWMGGSVAGAKILRVPIGSSGYEYGVWSTTVCAPDKCGFTIEYV